MRSLRPDLAVADCMLPAAIAAARATGTATASLIHFLYGLARTHMLRPGGGWTTDLRSLAATHRMLGLAVASDGLGAWEAPELLLVTAVRCRLRRPGKRAARPASRCRFPSAAREARRRPPAASADAGVDIRGL